MTSNRQEKTRTKIMDPTSRQKAIAALRKTGLFPVADELRFWWNMAESRSRNQKFKYSHPGEIFPGPRVSYDAYATVDYAHYWNGGMLSAQALLSLIKGEIDLTEAKLLEWGCGPGRIVRHLEPLVRPYRTKVFGCDYNRSSIAWCTSAIPEVTFAVNRPDPPLPFDSDFFDVLYSSSVFTHLSEEMHYAWLKENLRVLKRGGLLLFTTHGDRFKFKLLPEEISKYEAGEIVVRSADKEGKRGCAAFQSPAFVKERLLKSVPGIQLVRHDTQLPLAGLQDVWILRKA
jgi:SAM-dependent methyltransferase